MLSPELYITVLAYTSILNPKAPQVSLLVHHSKNNFTLHQLFIGQFLLPWQNTMLS